MNVVNERAMIFECAGERLIGIAHLPESTSQTIGVLIVVGGPQYRVGSHRQFTLMARAFAAAGYPVLRFDYRGMGDSDGAVLPFDQVDDDISAGIDALMNAASQVKRVVLWGLCDAASACMIYCNRRDDRVAGLIVANPWVRTEAGEATAYLKHYYLQRLLQKSFWKKLLHGAFDVRRSLRELLTTVSLAKSSGGSSLPQERGFLHRMLTGLRSLERSVLLLISERDLTAKEFTDLCSKDPSWRESIRAERLSSRMLYGADHTFSLPKDLEAAISVCTDWIAGQSK